MKREPMNCPRAVGFTYFPQKTYNHSQGKLCFQYNGLTDVLKFGFEGPSEEKMHQSHQHVIPCHSHKSRRPHQTIRS